MEQLRRVAQLGWVRQILHRELARPFWSLSYQSARPGSPGNECDLVGIGVVTSRAESSSVGGGRAGFSVLTLNNIAPNPGAHRRAVSGSFGLFWRAREGDGVQTICVLKNKVLKTSFLLTIVGERRRN